MLLFEKMRQEQIHFYYVYSLTKYDLFRKSHVLLKLPFLTFIYPISILKTSVCIICTQNGTSNFGHLAIFLCI